MKTYRNLLTVFAMVSVCHLSPCFSQTSVGTYIGKNKTLIPTAAWDCNMPDGIPSPEKGELVFKATVKLNGIYEIGTTPYGTRTVFVTDEGSLEGEIISGEVMAGGLDFQLSFSNGAMEIEQVLVLKTNDGKFIYVRTAGTATDASDVRFVPDFEAPSASDFAWLNSGKYVGRRVIDKEAKTMTLSVYDVSALEIATDSENSIPVTKPEGVKNQPWEYRTMAAGETRSDPLIVENVTLGGSQSVGQTQGGGRNIIPITGGTLEGKITGKVLFGGADYQKMGNPFTLDARYLWQTEEGDVIIVRNAGPISSLVPIFEVNVNSNYAFLNVGTYASSPPGMGAGGVSLTFYETDK